MSFFGQPLLWRALRKTGAAGLAMLLAAGWTSTAVANAAARGLSGGSPATVALASLPNEARATYRLIFSDGPFPYSKDGVVFGNREHLLPAKPRGYYHEYPVRTSGAHDRGARRIVCGGEPPSRPEACFYTGDHYASFRMIAP